MIDIGTIFLICLIIYILLKRRDLIKLNLRIERMQYILFIVFVIFLLFVINFLDKKIAFIVSNHYPQGLLANYPVLNETLTDIFKGITHLGEPNYLALVALPAFLYFRYKKNTKLQTLILSAVVIMMFGSLISTILKAVFVRSRPYEEWNNFGFYFITDVLQKRVPYNGDYMSFPSGHTMVASCGFFYLAMMNKNIHMKIFWSVIPILVAISRVYLSYHWLSDVLASLLFGLFLAKKYKDSLDPSSLNDLS